VPAVRGAVGARVRGAGGVHVQGGGRVRVHWGGRVRVQRGVCVRVHVRERGARAGVAARRRALGARGFGMFCVRVASLASTASASAL
jgi:hypothetical protein